MDITSVRHRPDGKLQPGDRIWRSMLDSGTGFSSWINYAYRGQGRNSRESLERSDFEDVKYVLPRDSYYACSSGHNGYECRGVLKVVEGQPHAPGSTVIIGSCFECTACGCQTNCATVRPNSQRFARAVTYDSLEGLEMQGPRIRRKRAVI